MQTANLVQVTNELFTYNADGLRVATSGTAETKKIIWDGQAYLLETDSSNVTQVVYTQGVGPFGDLVSQRRSGATSYYLFDALGSTDRLISAAQAVLNSYVYKAFGEIASSTGSTANPFRFVGRYGYYYYGWSLGSDLYVRARWYKPVQARWLSIDPLGFAAGDWNLLRYGGNNPIYLIDATGMDCWGSAVTKCLIKFFVLETGLTAYCAYQCRFITNPLALMTCIANCHHHHHADVLLGFLGACIAKDYWDCLHPPGTQPCVIHRSRKRKRSEIQGILDDLIEQVCSNECAQEVMRNFPPNVPIDEANKFYENCMRQCRPVALAELGPAIVAGIGEYEYWDEPCPCEQKK